MSTAWIIVSAILAGALVLLWLRHTEVAKTLAAKSDELRSLGSRIDALGAAHTQAHDEKAVSLARLDAEISRLQTTLGAANERSEVLATELQKVRESSSQATAFLSADVAQRLLTLSADVTSGLDAGEKRLVQTLTAEKQRIATAEAALDRRVEDLVAASERRLEEFIAKETGAVARRIDDLDLTTKGAQTDMLRLVDETKAALTLRLDDSGRQLGALADAMKSPLDVQARKEIAQVKAGLKTCEKQLTTAIDGERTRINEFLLRLSTSNSAGYLRHVRQLTEQSALDIIDSFAKALGLTLTPRELTYTAHRICLLEDRCIGRIATTIETILVRVLAARHLIATHGHLRVLETGTLFGISAGALYERNRLLCDDIQLTLIDPLDGYYGAGQDVVTGEPVTPRTLDINMQRIGVPLANLTVLQGLSQDPAIRKACEGRAFNLFIIDGDHSREGVKRDFENYRDLIVPGGLIAFDDFDTKEWPDIKAYVDDEIAPRSDLELVAKGWRTALYRVLPQPA